MKNFTSSLVILSATSLFGCTFHPPTMADLADQMRLSSEEAVALRECERNSGAITSVTQCQQRARSLRMPGQGAYSVKQVEPFEPKGQLRE